jgi:hypothetical protein
MLIAQASVLERNARFPVFIRRCNSHKRLRFCLSPSLDADIIELIFARFAFLGGRHVDVNQVFLRRVE